MRFTLKALLAAVLVSAIVCGVFFALPAVLTIFVLMAVWIFTPPALIAGIIYGRGYGRAFSIGVVMAGGGMPLVWAYLSFTGAMVLFDENLLDTDAGELVVYKIAFAVLYALMGGSGLVSMAVRWWSLKLQAAAEPAISPSSVLHGRVTTARLQSMPLRDPASAET